VGPTAFPVPLARAVALPGRLDRLRAAPALGISRAFDQPGPVALGRELGRLRLPAWRAVRGGFRRAR
jgi:hypothetical protein